MNTAYPPGPRLPRLLQTLVYAKWRARFLATQAERFGDVFTLRLTPPYAEHLVVFSRPDHIREIFAGDPADLHAGEGNRVLGQVMGEHSLLLTDEAEHARARRLLMPAFGASALRGYRALVEEIAAARVSRWQPGQTLPTLDAMNELTLEVIMRVVFGVSDRQRRDQLTPRLRRLVDINPLMLFGGIWPRLQTVGPWRRMRENQDGINELLYAEIHRRRADSESAPGADVLSRLLAAGAGDDSADTPLSDAELRDQLVTLLLAGHETTASALAWAMHELAAAPDIQDRARRAAREGDEKYLEAVLKEAMRRRTVIGGVARKLTRDMTIGGWDLPRGTVVATSILLAHSNPQRHPEPDRFRPDRFLDGSVAVNTWLPFGGGVRRCIGAGFSLMEGTVVLREVLSRYTLSLPPGAHSERGRIRNITHIPADGARVVLTANPPPGTPTVPEPVSGVATPGS
ncbi:cytochrome P450 [Nocardia sp. NEAU-G5]|uniref:Cytochrome P450 n=1 Tax=Nocardia albiluteola TaxID=2842303 RepID=A0ABS6B5Z3_9NOCA|nr:cytochrome P450 [Nocardia albiluteola]MBU3064574.1 cytochrome P450 [Nocardia albiluteola]